jgi:hypothetical protein
MPIGSSPAAQSSRRRIQDSQKTPIVASRGTRPLLYREGKRQAPKPRRVESPHRAQSAPKTPTPASTQKMAPTHHNSCHADDALTPPSTAASQSAPPRRPRPSVAFLHLVRLWAKEHPSRLQHLRRLRRFYKLQFHYAAGRRGAIWLDNPFVTIIKGKACLSLYRRPHHLAELVYAGWLVVAL